MKKRRKIRWGLKENMISSRKQEIGKNGESGGERMQEEKEEGEKGEKGGSYKEKNNA